MVNNNKARVIDCVVILVLFAVPIIFYWNTLSRDELMISGDGMNFFVPKIYQYKTFLSGEMPLWNSYVIAGIPLFEDPNNSFFYPIHALALFFPPTLYTNLYYIIHIGMAGFFTYLFLKQTSSNRLTAFAGAVVFSMSIILGGSRKEHGWIYSTIIWLPLILYFIRLYIDTEKKRNLIYSAMAMTMQFFVGSPQYALYSDVLAFVYFLYSLLSQKLPMRKILELLLLWASSYLLFSAVFLVPIMELIIQSARRAADYFCLYSSRWDLLLMTLFPYVFGSNISHPLGDYASAEISIELYLGIIPLIYALYATLFYFSNHFIKFNTVAIVITFIYSSSCNIPHLGEVLHKFPILGLFNVQSRILFIFVFSGICCFAYGISDLSNPQYAKRLLVHSTFMVVLIVFIAAIVSAVGQYLVPNVKDASHHSITSSTFSISIAIAVVNLLLVAILYFINKENIVFKYASALVVTILLGITLWDVGRFSLMNTKTRFDTLVNTEETTKLKELLKDEPYRIITSYDQIYGGDYQQSGLVDNWSMVNKIRNIKGRSEFQDPRLNELLGQAESRDSANTNWLISENSILSMLSIRYVLIPLGDSSPKEIPTLPDVTILSERGPITIPGNSFLFVDSIPISVEAGRYYHVEFDVDVAENSDIDVKLLYVDFYGGPAFDKDQQQKVFTGIKDDNSYSAVIYVGNGPIPADASFRIVGISASPLTITNLKVVKLVPAPDNPEYVLVDQTSRYEIYENKRAQKLLYIPEQVKAINDDSDLRANPENYPQMDQISYTKGYKNLETGGELEILSVKNNSLTARVRSQNTTFVNHSQSFYPGWKAYVDNQPTPIYLVNDVIQGIEVPSGIHIIKFIYDPLSLQVGAAISIMALITASVFIVHEKRGHKTTMEESS